MGVRQISEANSLGKNRPYVASNFKRQWLYDGVSTTGTGDQANVPGNKILVDGTGLHRLGLNNGPTFQNVGAGSVLIQASQMPAEYAELVKTDAGVLTRISASLITLATLTTNQTFGLAGKVYSLYYLTFDAPGGACHAMSL